MKKNDVVAISELYRYALSETIPLSATIELLNNCNLRCEHCYIPNHVDMGMPFEKLKEILVDLKKLGTLDLLLTGGEIFLRKDLIKIVQFARTLGMRVTLFTNATMVKKTQLEELAECHISDFSCSIYSMNPAIHDSITGVKGSLERTLANLRLAKKCGLNCSVKTVVMKKNVLDWKDIFDYCQENEFEYMAPASVMPKLDGDVSPLDFQLNYEQMKALYTEESQYGMDEDTTIVPWSDEEYICNQIHYNLYIQCDGNVYPCNSFYYKIGNVMESRIQDIWNKTPEHKFLLSLKKKNLDKCCKCGYKQYCIKCPGSSLMEHGDLFECSSADYNNARIAKEMRI